MQNASFVENSPSYRPNMRKNEFDSKRLKRALFVKGLKSDQKVTFEPQKSLLSHLGQNVTFLVTFESLLNKGEKSLFLVSFEYKSVFSHFGSVAGRVFHNASCQSVVRKLQE